MDCSTALTNTAPTPGSTLLAYNIGTPTSTFGDAISSFFTNADTINCPASCSVMNQGCATSYSGTKVTMNAAMPFTLTAQQNVITGYTEYICVKCTTTGPQTITIDNHMVKQALDCNFALFSNNPTDLTLQYDALLPASPEADYDVFYGNHDYAICGITSCTLYDAGCLTPYSGSYLSLGVIGDKFALKADRSHIPGYSETVCYSCTNGL